MIGSSANAVRTHAAAVSRPVGPSHGQRPGPTASAESAATRRPASNTSPAQQPLLASETQAALLAVQQADEPAGSQEKTISINGLSIITSGHSADNRPGVSLLRTVHDADLQAALVGYADKAAKKDEAVQPDPDADPTKQRLTIHGGMVELEATKLDALPGGALSAYVTDDFFRTGGSWDGGNPIEKSSTPEGIRADQRMRLEHLMNSVDTERQLRAQYGDDVKLVYSHVDQSYIMLTPDDAQYDMVESVESGVQTVINEVRRGYVDKDLVSDTLARYGYYI